MATYENYKDLIILGDSTDYVSFKELYQFKRLTDQYKKMSRDQKRTYTKNKFMIEVLADPVIAKNYRERIQRMINGKWVDRTNLIMGYRFAF